MQFLNEKPLEHTSSNSTRFTATRCDLKSGVQVEKPVGISEPAFARDVAEFAAWHRSCIVFDIRTAEED